MHDVTTTQIAWSVIHPNTNTYVDVVYAVVDKWSAVKLIAIMFLNQSTIYLCANGLSGGLCVLSALRALSHELFVQNVTGGVLAGRCVKLYPSENKSWQCYNVNPNA